MLLTNGMGGISAEGIRYVMELERLNSPTTDLTCQKIITYLTTAITTSNKDNKTYGTENKNGTRSKR